MSKSQRNILIVVAITFLIVVLGVLLSVFAINPADNNSPELFLSMAQKYILDMNYEQAIVYFDKVIEVDPMNVDAYLGKVNALVASNQIDIAIAVLEEAYISTGDARFFDMLQSLRKETEVFQEPTEEKQTIPTAPADDFKYEVNEDGNITIAQYIGTATEVGIPAYIDGKSVTMLDNAFHKCNSVTSVYLPPSIEDVGDIPFYLCQNLEAIEVDINNKCYISYEGVLFNKDKTVLISCPPALKANNYSIPDTVNEIYGYAFNGCEKLNNIFIPNNVTKLGKCAFLYCTSLADLIVTQSVSFIDEDVFDNCTSLHNIFVDDDNAYYCDLDGVLFNKSLSNIVAYPQGRTETTYSIPNTVTVIEDGVFFACNLCLVEIPNGVTSIGWGAFMASDIESIIIPESVRVIDPQAFSYCSSLQSITFMNGLEKIGHGAFYNCTALTELWLPSTVTEIGVTAFENCEGARIHYRNKLYTQDNIGTLWNSDF